MNEPQLSNNALNQLAVEEVSRRLKALGVLHESTGRSSANPRPGHIVIHAPDDRDYFIFVRVARLKVQVDRSRKVIAGRVLEYRYERACWEANIGSHGRPIEPAPDFWAIVLSSESPDGVDDRDPILMIPNDRVEGQTLRIAEKGPMSRWLIYLDWALFIAATHPEWIDANDVFEPDVSRRKFHPTGYRSTTGPRVEPDPDTRTPPGGRRQPSRRRQALSPSSAE
jgi:hypothetical protein